MAVAVLDLLDQVDAVAALERDIDHGQVRLGLGNQAERLAQAGGLAANIKVILVYL
jgi:hypothetical protein